MPAAAAASPPAAAASPPAASGSAGAAPNEGERRGVGEKDDGMVTEPCLLQKPPLHRVNNYNFIHCIMDYFNCSF